MIVRRGILGALAGLVAAPAIIKVADLMPINSGLLLPSRNSLLTIDQITQESVRLFKNSNMFLRYWSHEDDDKIGSTLRIRLPNDYVARYDGKLDMHHIVEKPAPSITAAQAAALGAAAILTNNPTISRRLWSTS